MKNNTGFTLLELLIALSLGALVMAATYSVVGRLLNVQQLLDSHGSEMHQYLHLRRVLSSDFAARLSFKPVDVQFETDKIDFDAHGRVEWNQRMGAVVRVRYQWQQLDNNQWQWQRQLVSADGYEVLDNTMKINQGLKSVNYQVLTEQGWLDPLSTDPAQIKAVRWQFDWQHIGQWPLVLSMGRQL